MTGAGWPAAILLRDDLGVVPDALRLAPATFTTIRRDLVWAFCYNLAGNSLRLRRFRAGAVVESDG